MRAHTFREAPPQPALISPPRLHFAARRGHSPLRRSGDREYHFIRASRFLYGACWRLGFAGRAVTLTAPALRFMALASFLPRTRPDTRALYAECA